MGSQVKRDFIDLSEHDGGYLRHLLDLTGRLKSGAISGRPLEGRCLAMIFRKSSTRTRVSTEAGMAQLGGHALMISDRDSQMGRGESVRDTARVLSRYVDAILIRTIGHDEVVELAREASVPVINGLTDLLHPCQVMADLVHGRGRIRRRHRRAPRRLGRGREQHGALMAECGLPARVFAPAGVPRRLRPRPGDSRPRPLLQRCRDGGISCRGRRGCPGGDHRRLGLDGTGRRTARAREGLRRPSGG